MTHREELARLMHRAEHQPHGCPWPDPNADHYAAADVLLARYDITPKQEASPRTEVQIELRDWIILGETIADDVAEHGLTLFVAADDIHEIIAAYLKANGITPLAVKS